MTINMNSKQLFNGLQFMIMIAILGLLLWSQPWSGANTNAETRKITVVGDATIETEPDEFQFSPYFQETGTDKNILKESLTTKTNDAVAKLKELGVEERDIRVDASSYDYWYAVEDQESPMTVSLNVAVSNKELAQKVQDYFQTLDLNGQLTPFPAFSKEKQKELDAQVVEKATEDAKKKAEAQVRTLGAKLGKVIEVKQGIDYGSPITLDMMSGSELNGTEERSSLPVLPGENEYTQSVTVTYELK